MKLNSSLISSKKLIFRTSKKGIIWKRKKTVMKGRIREILPILLLIDVIISHLEALNELADNVTNIFLGNSLVFEFFMMISNNI